LESKVQQDPAGNPSSIASQRDDPAGARESADATHTILGGHAMATVLTSYRPDRSQYIVVGFVGMVVLAYVGWLALSAGTHHAIAHEPALHAAEPAHTAHPAPPSLYSVLPFATLLLAIAVLPLAESTRHWWESNRSRFLVASLLGLLTLAYYAVVYEHGVIDHGAHRLSQPGIDAAATVFRNAIFGEYVPFIVLLFSLYVIAGGISLRGDLEARPAVNTAFMATGAGLASFIGTTGAAMLLIRPLLKTNSERRHVTHTVIFFIFIVCNIGGCLLPIGDPPLFLGYLKGVPFFWTLNLWPAWLAVNATLVAIYYLWDRLAYRREEVRSLERDQTEIQPLHMKGGINFFWIGGVIAAVILLDPSKEIPLVGVSAPPFCREVVMLALAALSLVSTPTGLREENRFSYVAIIEVAALFFGIFICMQAPVQILNARGPELGIDTAAKFFWSTGLLSSFLDNAPTYVVFFETARSLPAGSDAVAGVGVAYSHLVAISLGAVFMGACTYIGNGPNFMVKSIAEQSGVKMPSFFGYMMYSIVVLMPVFLVVTFVFL
jgi:Na+/H+ antiporter NhaD/arsenite permease-like protein